MMYVCVRAFILSFFCVFRILVSTFVCLYVFFDCAHEKPLLLVFSTAKRSVCYCFALFCLCYIEKQQLSLVDAQQKRGKNERNGKKWENLFRAPCSHFSSRMMLGKMRIELRPFQRHTHKCALHSHQNVRLLLLLYNNNISIRVA